MKFHEGIPDYPDHIIIEKQSKHSILFAQGWEGIENKILVVAGKDYICGAVLGKDERNWFKRGFWQIMDGGVFAGAREKVWREIDNFMKDLPTFSVRGFDEQVRKNELFFVHKDRYDGYNRCFMNLLAFGKELEKKYGRSPIHEVMDDILKDRQKSKAYASVDKGLFAGAGVFDF